MSCLLAVVAWVALGMATPATAWAQLTPQQKQEVRQHYEKATRAYDIGKYDEAIAEYQNVYEISGDSKMLYNIGQAYRLNGQPEQALRFYRRYLQRLPNAVNREDVEKKIADQEKALEEQKATAAAAAAAAAAPPPPAVTPSPAPIVLAPPPTSPPPSPPPSTFSPGLRIASYVCLATGGAALGFSAVAGYMAKSKGEQLTKDSDAGKTFDPSLQSQGKLWDKLALGSVIGGGALVITGGILFFVSGSQETEHAQASGRFVALPVLGPDGAGVAGSLVF
jgi:tetratricopeptide (TPR) repeat protein